MIEKNNSIVNKRRYLINFYYILATGFFSGLSPVIPGTIGSLVSLPFWWLMTFLPLQIYLLLILIGIIFGVFLCYRVTCEIGIYDHRSIVWDEFIGMWITLITIPAITWQWVLVSFSIFRIFDLWKPWPICWCDQNIHGGLGIITDDIVAGIISACILYGLGYIFY